MVDLGPCIYPDGKGTYRSHKRIEEQKLFELQAKDVVKWRS